MTATATIAYPYTTGRLVPKSPDGGSGVGVGSIVGSNVGESEGLGERLGVFVGEGVGEDAGVGKDVAVWIGVGVGGVYESHRIS